MSGAGARLVVLLDDELTGVCRVRIDAERLNTKSAQRTPMKFAVDDGNRLDLVDADGLQALASRKASSTIGSIRWTPAARSSRFAVPAQSSNAFAKSPS
jgi:hypothetical protein